ncbi:hypothetical protein ZHAS_00009348 [Anopheles sinensis]|uniref:Uncharacterized protein n=1 Tax=Anopheles sinensis TaxID=74873 RepID=A0A084VUR6_ANOSI|nr:hypothetical protein ZHAS_00009348 [Anopheles sinensis]
MPTQSPHTHTLTRPSLPFHDIVSDVLRCGNPLRKCSDGWMDGWMDGDMMMMMAMVPAFPEIHPFDSNVVPQTSRAESGRAKRFLASNCIACQYRFICGRLLRLPGEQKMMC